MLYFYQPHIQDGQEYLVDTEYQHCVKVLRKSVGDEIGIFNGQGGSYHAAITEITNKQCKFNIISQSQIEAKPFKTHIAIAPTKNVDRIEWFVEKACELGVDEISFILTSNSERRKMRIDRLEKKAVSALKQSKNGFLTRINDLVPFQKFVEQRADEALSFVAHVSPNLPYFSSLLIPQKDIIILIGPEGDFTKEEVELATKSRFSKVSLGNSVLRTETAGLVSASFVNIANHY